MSEGVNATATGKAKGSRYLRRLGISSRRFPSVVAVVDGAGRVDLLNKPASASLGPMAAAASFCKPEHEQS